MKVYIVFRTILNRHTEEVIVPGRTIGAFSTYEKAEEYLNSFEYFDSEKFSLEDYIQELTIDVPPDILFI